MLGALAAGTEDVKELVELAKGSLRRKRQELEQALSGQIRSHHRFLIANHPSVTPVARVKVITGYAVV